jgi:hypothetical protein
VALFAIFSLKSGFDSEYVICLMHDVYVLSSVLNGGCACALFVRPSECVAYPTKRVEGANRTGALYDRPAVGPLVSRIENRQSGHGKGTFFLHARP